MIFFIFAGCPSPVKPSEKVTITYDNNGHGTAPEKKSVDKGTKLTETDLPELTDTDCFFCGWEIGGRKAISGEPVNNDITLKAIWKNDIPEFSVASGEVDYQTSVELSYFQEDAKIYYTENGSEPSEGSLLYTKALKITRDCTIKAVAIKDGKLSKIATAEYKIKLYTVTFETNGHGLPHDSIQKHKWEQIELPQVIPEANLQFNYWTDGIDNYSIGELYTVTGDVTFTANWIGLNDVKTPKISPEGEYADYNDKITITSETEGAEIFYTTDGTDPFDKAQKYTGPFTIKKDMTIKAIAQKNGMNTSNVSKKTYKIKKYELTFDATGHGIPPQKITGIIKGDVIKLPDMYISELFWTFLKWSDGKNTYAAGDDYTISPEASVDGIITLKAVWKEIPDVIELKASYPESRTVKLSWTIPDDKDYAKAVIFCDEKISKEVKFTDNPNNEVIVKDLTNETEYTFVVKAYGEYKRSSNGVSIKVTPHIPTPLEFSAGTKLKNVIGTQSLVVSDIMDHMYVDENKAGKISFNLTCFNTSNEGSYQWYKGSSGNWQKANSTSTNIKVDVVSGTTYYMLEAKSKDGTSITYSNVCTVVCGGPITKKIGNILYSDGTSSEKYLDTKEPVGIVLDVYPDDNTTIKTIVNLNQSEKIQWKKSAEYLNTLRNGIWKIPAMDELMSMYCNRDIINERIFLLNRKNVKATSIGTDWFLSSLRKTGTSDKVWVVDFSDGVQFDYVTDGENCNLRAVAKVN